MKRDYKFWVVTALVLAFAVFVWPTPFYRAPNRTALYWRFTGHPLHP